MFSLNEEVSCLRYTATNGWAPSPLQVIRETSLTLSVNGFEWISFQCTPHELVELACGFLYNEGFVENREEIVSAELCPDGSHLDLWLTHAVTRPESWKRTSGCGGGATRGDAPLQKISRVPAPQFEPSQILSLMDELAGGQRLYRETGGIHSSALSDGKKLIHLCEDIGRHNTLDKLAGYLLLKPRPQEQRLLLTTGRVSAEMLQKAVRMGCEIIASRTSPTSESIRLATQAGITLVGYARHSQMTIYTHAIRLGMDHAPDPTDYPNHPAKRT